MLPSSMNSLLHKELSFMIQKLTSGITHYSYCHITLQRNTSNTGSYHNLAVNCCVHCDPEFHLI